jgi:hypothetical protein
MPDSKTLRALIRFVTWLMGMYAGGYLLLTHIARIGYGEYDGVESVRIPTWGRMWDLTPVIALVLVGLLWGYLMSKNES